MDDNQQFELWATINRFEEVFSTGIFEPGRIRDTLFQSAFTEIMILLYDVLKQSADLDHRIDFDDHVLDAEQTKDVTDLVAKVRGACCHLGSKSRQVRDTQALSAFNIVTGRGKAMSLGGVQMGCDFDDDIACWFGGHRIYIRRHILRAFSEAKTALAPYLSGMPRW